MTQGKVKSFITSNEIFIIIIILVGVRQVGREGWKGRGRDKDKNYFETIRIFSNSRKVNVSKQKNSPRDCENFPPVFLRKVFFPFFFSFFFFVVSRDLFFLFFFFFFLSYSTLSILPYSSYPIPSILFQLALSLFLSVQMLLSTFQPHFPILSAARVLPWRFHFLF